MIDHQIVKSFNNERALELLAQMRKATLDAIVARNDYKAARTARRDALLALRDSRRKMNDFLAGRDPEAQLPLALNGNGASNNANVLNGANGHGPSHN